MGTQAIYKQLSGPQATAVANLAANGEAYLATGSIPAFSSNAATIAPGTDAANYYPLPSTTVLAANSTLTLSTASMPDSGLIVHVAIENLNLTHTLAIVNGGLSNTMVTVAATLSPARARVYHFLWDGTNFTPQGYDFAAAFTG